MLIVPELQTVFILVPRTGTGTLHREIRRVYPNAMLLYRHMEADGVPQGYDRWKRVGVVRHPLMRLESLYSFMKSFGGGSSVQHNADTLRVRTQVSRPFKDWLLNNEQPFTTPADLSGEGAYWPVLSKRDPSPENKRSQFSYLRPDLGTTLWRFEDLGIMLREYGLDPTVIKNSSSDKSSNNGMCDPEIREHIYRYCAWDLQQNCTML